MSIESVLTILTELIAYLLREGVALLGTVVATSDVAAVWRFAPIVALPFAVMRSFWRGAFGLGVALLGMEIYFVYNRLTVFANKPLSLAELLGNLSELLLALILLIRKERWERARRPHAGTHTSDSQSRPVRR